jgi:hypothetical protein
MSAKKYESILSLIEVAEKNLKNAREMLQGITQEQGIKVTTDSTTKPTPPRRSQDEAEALEVVEGYFDGENMIGDNGQIYPVPQNYASKTQLVIGDRMKWIMTSYREIFKLIQPAARRRVTGTFTIEGDSYIVLVDEFPAPVKILKASATYAIKNLSLSIGDAVAIYIPQDATPVWGAFISVVKGNETKPEEATTNTKVSELDDLNEFKIDTDKPASEADFF